MAVLSVAVVAAGAFAFVSYHFHDQQSSASLTRSTGIPSDISTPLANLMELAPLPNQPAPNFDLIDQAGRRMSLASFRGHPVVLEFMDPHCTDICPIVSQEFVDAYHDLGPSGAGVAFVAVNVNEYNRTVADMQVYSKAQGLDTIPSWHFFTGPVKDLESVWKAYGIDVYAPSPTADVEHTSTVFFIDSEGHERFMASPMDDQTSNGTAYLPASQLASWGQGIALTARGLQHT
jgi:cytochrome oxidase Cu insertion factor (SCO1/SenC/PrrC family)